MKFFLPVRKKKLIKRKEKEEENDKEDEAAEFDDNQIDYGEDLKEQEDIFKIVPKGILNLNV